jgi:Tol biopolymer transport system component
LAYVGPDSAGGTQLWIRDLNSLTGRPLAGTSGAQAPFFAPDGRSVAFFTGNPGSLQLVSISGGAPRTVVQDSALPWGGDWAEDGTFYFTHAQGRVARVRARGGAVEIVSRFDSASGVTEHDWVQILPGNRFLLVQLWHNSVATAEIGLLDLNTGTATPIVQGFYGRYVPSGHVVYATVNGMLHRVPFDPGSGKVTGPPATIAERILIDAESGSAQFSLSDNGILAYSAGGREGSGRVVWVDRDGRQSPVDTTWRGQFGGVALSPDDTRIAIAVYGDAGLQIWIKDLPAGPLSRVTLGFTPDGSRFLLRLGASAGARDLYLGTLGDSARRPLVSSAADEFAPAVSPDGRWFAYVSNESGRNEVFVRSLDDPAAGRTQVSTGGGEEVRWARSGRELFYRTRAGEMMAVEVTGGVTFRARPPRRLFTAPGMAGDSYHHGYAVARDGRFLMINQTAVSGDLVMVFNWQDELRGRR